MTTSLIEGSMRFSRLIFSGLELQFMEQNYDSPILDQIVNLSFSV